MFNNQFQSKQKKPLAEKQTIANTTAEKLKQTEYSVDKSAKKPDENPAPASKDGKV